MNRRSFLKLGAGALVAAVAAPAVERFSAPLYIPAERLEMGVPKAIVTAPDPRIEQWIRAMHQQIAEDLVMWGQFPVPPDAPLVWEEAPRFYDDPDARPFLYGAGYDKPFGRVTAMKTDRELIVRQLYSPPEELFRRPYLWKEA